MGELTDKLEIFDNTYHGGEPGEYFVETSALRERLQAMFSAWCNGGPRPEEPDDKLAVEFERLLQELA